MERRPVCRNSWPGHLYSFMTQLVGTGGVTDDQVVILSPELTRDSPVLAMETFFSAPFSSLYKPSFKSAPGSWELIIARIDVLIVAQRGCGWVVNWEWCRGLSIVGFEFRLGDNHKGLPLR